MSVIHRLQGLVEHKQPAYRITLNGDDITENFAGRLRRLHVTDNRGLEADQVRLELDDSDGRLRIPKHGEKLTIAIGWQGEALIEKGVFTVDETEHNGAVDTLSISARSADISTDLLKKRQRSFHKTSVGEVINTLAAECELNPLIDATLAAKQIEHIDQTDESAVNLLTRLGRIFDAVATVKSGYMIFMPIGAGRSISGRELGHVTLTRKDGDSHRYNQSDRQSDSITGVSAKFYDTNNARLETVTVGSDERPKELRHTHTDETSAREAATAEWQRLQRQNASMSYLLALGRPELQPEMTFSITGIKASLDDTRWLCQRIAHRIDNGGFMTSIELEIKTN